MTGIIKYEAFINISTALIAQGWTIFGFSNVNIHQTCQEKYLPQIVNLFCSLMTFLISMYLLLDVKCGFVPKRRKTKNIQKYSLLQKYRVTIY